jgi:CHASE2 domain-containing sensor protein
LPEKKRPFWERVRSALRSILFSLVLTGLLIAAQKALKQWTDFGRQLDQMGARLLQVRLSDSSGWRGDPVRIVDISSMAPSSPASVTEGAWITHRDELKKYLRLVALAGPTAIGIDVIFDPSPDGIVSREDSDFLDYCLNLTGPHGPIPVRVGIYSTLALGPDRWLGDPRFRELGASIIVPSEDEDHKSAPTGRMIRQFSFMVNNKTVNADSLSYSLFKIAQSEATKRRPVQLKWAQRIWWRAAGEARKSLTKKPIWLEHGKVSASTFLINFGSLQKMMNCRIPAKDIASHLPDPNSKCDSNHKDDQNHKCDLINKVVLIGRATPGEAPDAFTTAASDEPIPGIYIHAAAVYTLMEAPLYELSKWVGIWIDLLLALAIFVIDRWLDHLRGLGSHDKGRTTPSAISFLARATFSGMGAPMWLGSLPEVVVPALLAVCVLMVGVLFVVFTKFYWTDFVAVAIVLLIHKPLEAGCHIVWEVAQESPRLLWRKT